MNETIYGPKSVIYARSLDSLGASSRPRRRRSRGRGLLARPRRREVLGTRHPDVASSLNNLGMRKFDGAKFSEAEALIGQAVEIQREAAGLDSGPTLVFMNNLARAREGKGDLAGAETLLLEVLERRRNVLGKESAYVAVTEYYLSRLLCDNGRARDAEPYSASPQPS